LYQSSTYSKSKCHSIMSKFSQLYYSLSFDDF
jgi:hypothetical protein